LPLMIGGGGERRTIPTTARFADEWNTWGGPEKLIGKMAVLDRACEAIDRDPAAVQRSAALLVALRDTAATPAERAQGLAHPHPLLVGTAEQVTETLAEYQAAGVDEVIIPDFNWTAEETPDRLQRIATEIIPAFG
ncbi:MAG: LLM class F420-dependent oxidoreductase, partial [bacterium]|nr:LLM class F420-dependent oxidoreductase [bacterium]